MARQALSDLQSRIISVNREKLLATLRSNLTKHQADYEIAVAGYKAASKEKLEQAHAAALVSLEKNFKRSLEDIQNLDLSDPEKRSDHVTLVAQISVHLEVPRNFSEQYEAAIAQAEWDVRENLELTSAEFQCFVRDIWDWSSDFQKMSMTYAAAARRI